MGLCRTYVQCMLGVHLGTHTGPQMNTFFGLMSGPCCALYWLFIWAPMPEPRWKCLFEAYLGDMLGPCWAYVGLYWMMQDGAAWCNFVQLKPCRTARKKVLSILEGLHSRIKPSLTLTCLVDVAVWLNLFAECGSQLWVMGVASCVELHIFVLVDFLSYHSVSSCQGLLSSVGAFG